MKFKHFIKKKQVLLAASMLSKILQVPNSIKETRIAQEITEKYWIENNPKLINWLKKHKITLPKNQLPPYTDGGVGRAYFIGKYVIKFSSNRVEANIAELVKGRKDLPTAVIDTIHLENGIYAILQPYINMNISEEIKQAADYLMVLLDTYPNIKFPEQKHAKIKLCSSVCGDANLIPYMISLMDILRNLYKETGFLHDDASYTNVGMYGNEIVFPDLGPNQTKDYDDLRALSQLSKNRAKLGLPRHKSV